MARGATMRLFARWHIWLGWLVGFPILLWTVTGLIMVIKPIEEVRGNHLRLDVSERALPPDTQINVGLPDDLSRPVRSVTTLIEAGQTVTRIEYLDGSVERYTPDGREMGPLSEVEAQLLVTERIEGGDQVVSRTYYEADDVPFDFRRAMPVWQIALADGTHVYVGSETGRIEAVRTRWWRVFDFAWGLHIMDLQTREDTSHPILILFAVLSVLGALLGVTLMFRRRKARVST